MKSLMIIMAGFLIAALGLCYVEKKHNSGLQMTLKDEHQQILVLEAKVILLSNALAVADQQIGATRGH